MKQEDLIEKYFENRLSSEEKLAFDQLLKNDTGFKDELAFHTNLRRVAREEDEDNFKNLVYAFEKKIKRPQKKRSFVIWLAAASILLLLGLTYFIKEFNKPTADDLFASYFQPYENVISPVERSSDQPGEKELAFYTYDQGDYEAAVLLFSQLYDSTKESYYLFYKANALIELERANEAIPLLLEHLKTKDVLTGKTKWYLALAYLKEQDKKNAKKFLKEVTKAGKYKSKDAKELLKKMD